MMKPFNAVMDSTRDTLRLGMKNLAKPVDKLFKGKLTPNMVTLTSLFMHIPIAYLIATGAYGWAAALLLVFGLFDAFDGALASIQGKASSAGMLLDASTDRIKEVMLYTGAAYSFVQIGQPNMAAWAVVACGASLCVSYIKAKGETAMAGNNLTPNEINRLFQDGFARFEIRMLILIIGLVSSQLVLAVIIIALLASVTAVGRLISISKRLKNV